MSGPLTGLRFVEMAGIGPAPFASMLLADMGAEGIRVESPKARPEVLPAERDIVRRGRASVRIDAGTAAGSALVLDLVREADLIIEGYRPGVMERNGLGPDVCLAANPRLVYGRMTGWGQDGPWAQVAGHDLDYIALAGALAHIARRGQPPTPPLNLVGDYAGGSMFLVVGVLAALWEAQRSGRGQVVDAAMVDGVALLMSMFHSLSAIGVWQEEAGVNALDSGMPFYDAYRCADGGYLAVAAIEPKFYARWIAGAGFADAELPEQYDIAQWPRLREAFAARIAEKSREEWAQIFEGTDACVAPVLTMREAAEHHHLRARGTFVEVHGMMQAAPAPRFSRTVSAIGSAPEPIGASAATALPAWGIDPERVAALQASGVVG